MNSNSRLRLTHLGQLSRWLVAIRFDGNTGAVQELAYELAKHARWEPMLQCWIIQKDVLLGLYADRFSNLQEAFDALNTQEDENL